MVSTRIITPTPRQGEGETGESNVDKQAKATFVPFIRTPDVRVSDGCIHSYLKTGLRSRTDDVELQSERDLYRLQIGL